MGKMGSWGGWKVGKGGMVRLLSWERWAGGNCGMVGRKQRGKMELPLELHVPFWGIAVGKSQFEKMR